jgi:hypothetical protein
LLSAIGANAQELGTFADEVIRIEDRSDELHEAGRRTLWWAVWSAREWQRQD